MILIGENINITSKTIGQALREQQAEPVAALAGAEVAAGMDYLDLNIGPARKSGPELISWLVTTVHGAVDRPLSLDTTNVAATEAGIKLVRGKALVNSVSLQPERLAQVLPLVKKYGADVIGLLWGAEGMPRDANERCLLAVELVYKAGQEGIAPENIWIDPVVTPVSVDINQVRSCIEFMSMLGDIAPGCRSVVGLSNISNGTPNELRPIINRTYLMMLMRYGLYAAIVDAFDAELIAIARGQRPALVGLVKGIMDGEITNLSTLTPEETAYAKTVRVLTGQSLYSHSWLEL